MLTYTVHRKLELMREDQLESDKALVFIKDGFSWWAFLAPIIWLLWHRLWLAALGYVAVMVVFSFVGYALSFTDGVSAIAGLLINAFVGLEANNWRRSALGKRGLQEVADVIADDAEEASYRFFASRLPAQTG
jgi:hypothetical protein